jgi:cellulose 1,4-beta-cellobiosidase
MRRLVVAAVCAASFVVPALAQASPTEDVTRPGVLCGHHNHVVVGGTYMLRDPYWRGTGNTCITQQRLGFTVTKTPRRTTPREFVTTFPDIYRGCIWNMCTPKTNIPIRTSRIHHVRTRWHTVQRSGGTWNAAYELWFGKHRQTQGHADGAELMVWLNHHGACCVLRRHAPIVRIDGYRFYVQSWRPHDPLYHVSWNYIQFRMIHPRWHVDHFDLKPFIRYAERHHWIRPTWWLENVGAGFEIWHGGIGLRTTEFRAVVT